MSSPPPFARLATDLVYNDLDALASHMRHCAQAHGRWFMLRGELQRTCAIAASHLVTMACLGVLFGVALYALA
ncbi:hypothetical protein J7E70_32630 [Variovorax paradoxus]|nr:hypothetical protein [Variovorax paradoxus]MBT2305154.1 hypothetical protein [Variovorax paradoxus]